MDGTDQMGAYVAPIAMGGVRGWSPEPQLSILWTVREPEDAPSSLLPPLRL